MVKMLKACRSEKSPICSEQFNKKLYIYTVNLSRTDKSTKSIKMAESYNKDFNIHRRHTIPLVTCVSRNDLYNETKTISERPKFSNLVTQCQLNSMDR